MPISRRSPCTLFGRAEDTLALVSSFDRPGLRLMLDLCHAQIGEGTLIELCKRCLPWIGEIPVADVPGRCERRTGENQLSRRCPRAGSDGLQRYRRNGDLGRRRRRRTRTPALPQCVYAEMNGRIRPTAAIRRTAESGRSMAVLTHRRHARQHNAGTNKISRRLTQPAVAARVGSPSDAQWPDTESSSSPR